MAAATAATFAASKPCNHLFCPSTNPRPVICSISQCSAGHPHPYRQQLLQAKSSSSPSPYSSPPSISTEPARTSFEEPKPSPIRYVNDAVFDDGPAADSDGEGGNSSSSTMVSSASALVAAIRRASKSPVEFVRRVEKDHHGDNAAEGQRIALPSPDFHRLCVDQLDLFRRIIHPCALLSVYVRPAGSYIMDRLELRRVTLYPRGSSSDTVILVGNFSVPAGLRSAEAVLSNRQAEAIPECRAVVFPMVKHPFVVGFLVVELPDTDLQKEGSDFEECPLPEEYYALPPNVDSRSQIPNGDSFRLLNFTFEQRLNAISISRSLAMAYIMDQKAILLQQSSWQSKLQMSNLVEQIRGPLSSIQTLIKMLAVHTQRNEISHDIMDDIIVQSDYMRDKLQKLQDAVYFTKANILRFNEESLKKMDNYAQPESLLRQLPNDSAREFSYTEKLHLQHLDGVAKDSELPMPPLALAPLPQHRTRPCNVSDVLVDLVGAVKPLAHMQKRLVELKILSQSLQVAVEEPALRQALGNLIEGALLRTQVGGRVQIVSMGAPAGGTLIVIDDDGPDMHYMTQLHSLKPFGAELFAEQMMEDNMTWNFVAGLTVAREILESYGCVVRVISPRTNNAALGTGGTRVEVWLPSLDPPADSVPSLEA